MAFKFLGVPTNKLFVYFSGYHEADLLNKEGNSIGKSYATNEVKVDLTDGGCVIAFKIRRSTYKFYDGVRASTNTGLLTNESWKCSDEFENYWFDENFDDRSWENAVPNFFAEHLYKEDTSIDGDARPIIPFFSLEETNYCRKYICGSKNINSHP